MTYTDPPIDDEYPGRWIPRETYGTNPPVASTRWMDGVDSRDSAREGPAAKKEMKKGRKKKKRLVFQSTLPTEKWRGRGARRNTLGQRSIANFPAFPWPFATLSRLVIDVARIATRCPLGQRHRNVSEFDPARPTEGGVPRVVTESRTIRDRDSGIFYYNACAVIQTATDSISRGMTAITMIFPLTLRRIRTRNAAFRIPAGEPGRIDGERKFYLIVRRKSGLHLVSFSRPRQIQGHRFSLSFPSFSLSLDTQ